MKGKSRKNRESRKMKKIFLNTEKAYTNKNPWKVPGRDTWWALRMIVNWASKEYLLISCSLLVFFSFYLLFLVLSIFSVFFAFSFFSQHLSTF